MPRVGEATKLTSHSELTCSLFHFVVCVLPATVIYTESGLAPTMPLRFVSHLQTKIALFWKDVVPSISSTGNELPNLEHAVSRHHLSETNDIDSEVVRADAEHNFTWMLALHQARKTSLLLWKGFADHFKRSRNVCKAQIEETPQDLTPATVWPPKHCHLLPTISADLSISTNISGADAQSIRNPEGGPRVYDIMLLL